MAGAQVNPLLNPAQPLAGKPLAQAAQALTDAQTKGPLAELARQIAFNNRQGTAAQKLTAGQFNTLGQYGKLAVGDEANIANDLNSQLQGIGSQTQNSLRGLGLQAANTMLTHTPQGENPGALSSPAVQSLAAEQARQQGIAAQDAGIYRGFGANQGANYRGLAAANMGTYALKGQEALKGIAQATRLANEPINQKIADLRAQRGSLLATNEGKLRQQEISNAITESGLQIKKDALAQQLQIANANRDAANNRAWLAHLDRVASRKLTAQDQATALKLKALGMSFGGIASLLKTANKAGGGGGNGTIDGSSQRGVQTVAGAVGGSLPKPGWNPFATKKK